MNFLQRREAIRNGMAARGIDLLLGVHDGTHYSSSFNAVLLLSSFRSMADSAVLLHRDGGSCLIVTPAWEAERAQECASDMEVIGADDLLSALASRLARYGVPHERVGIAGGSVLPWAQAERVSALLGGKMQAADALVLEHSRCKTEEDIAHARVATRIAEQGYERMLELARPGLREDELAVELRWMMKKLGAEDNFLMLNAGPHNRAVAPCGSRKFEPGDLILTELSPAYKGQMTQICRTIVVGNASPDQKRCYQLLVDAFENGVKAAKPGSPMASVCNAVDEVLEAAGYGEYGRPPYLRLRRRGHGLGLGADLPGDVGPDNLTPLEPGMLFVLHPNQYLPETGYMMCGEPVLITAQGAEPLSQKRAALAELLI
jgi:Xaa-Pro dipeptidase